MWMTKSVRAVVVAVLMGVGAGCALPEDVEVGAHQEQQLEENVCGAQDAQGSGTCSTLIGAAWNGTGCYEVRGCNCIGADCLNLDPSLEACAERHATCVPEEPLNCGAMHAQGMGACDSDFGAAWNGSWCYPIRGCGCLGPDCDKLEPSLEACQTKYTTCTPEVPTSCEQTHAQGSGACDEFLGVAWNGTQCYEVRGCSCIGSECDTLEWSLEGCELRHYRCGG
jgi:hypothetical protein